MSTHGKFTFSLEPTSEDHIQSNGIQDSDLWMVLTFDGSMHGPFITQRLKQYANEHAQEFKSIKVSSLEDGKWKEFSEVAKFQGRAPKLVSSQSLVSNEKFHVIKNGLKHGPFVTSELKVLLERKELLISDEISTDGGKSWMKLYQHHEFDHLATKNQNLPHKPGNQSFHESDNFTRENISQIKYEKSVHDDAIVGLAYLGHNKDNIHHDFDKTEVSGKAQPKYSKPEVTQDERKFKLRYLASALGVFLILFAVVNTFHNKFTDHSKKDSVAKRRVFKTKKVVSQSKISIRKPAKTVAKNKSKRLYPRAKRKNSYSASKSSRRYGASSSRSRNRKRISQSHKGSDDFSERNLDHDKHRDIASSEDDPEVEEIKREMLEKLRDEEDDDSEDDASEYVDESEEDFDADDEDFVDDPEDF